MLLLLINELKKINNKYNITVYNGKYNLKKYRIILKSK